MTGSLVGYLVYRVQESLKVECGTLIHYEPLASLLTEVLLELSRDMEPGQWIELPDGRALTIGKRLDWREE